MKDMFEERLKEKLQSLEQDPGIGDMLDRQAIWKRIEAGQSPVIKRNWRPRVMQMAAALICCLGIALFVTYQQQTTTNIQQARTAAIMVPARQHFTKIRHKEEVINKENVPGLQERSTESVNRAEAMLTAATQKEQIPVDNSPGPAEHKAPGGITEQPLPAQKSESPQLAIVYLSDLEQENPAVTVPKRSPDRSRIVRYMKSNLEDYASSLPPRVIINQILSK